MPVEANLDSSSYSGEASPNTDSNSESIFGRLFNFFGSFSGGSGGCETGIPSSPYLSSSVEDGERIREENEKTFLGWLFEGGGGPPLINMDPSHPSNNPPLFLGEHIPPSDS